MQKRHVGEDWAEQVPERYWPVGQDCVQAAQARFEVRVQAVVSYSRPGVQVTQGVQVGLDEPPQVPVR